MTLPRLILVAGCSLVVGCSITEPRGCDLCTTSAVVFGRVTNQQGQPVAKVWVDVHVFRDSCTQVAAEGGTDSLLPQTDSQGNYEAKPFALYAPFTAKCVRVVVNPRGQVAGVSTDTLDVPAALALRADYGSGRLPARDSMRVDIQVGR